MTTHIEAAQPTFHQQVEEFFLSKRGKGGQLSSFDYPVIQDWHNAGISVELIKRVIETGFERNSSIGTLKYFRNAVADEVKRNAELNAGGRPGPTAPPQPILNYKQAAINHINRLCNELSTVWPNVPSDLAWAIESVGWRLTLESDTLEKTPLFDSEALEARLDALEAELDNAIRAQLPADQVQATENETDVEFRHLRFKWDRQTYQDFLRLAVRKKLFAQFSIPRFSQFYMQEGR